MPRYLSEEAQTLSPRGQVAEVLTLRCACPAGKRTGATQPAPRAEWAAEAEYHAAHGSAIRPMIFTLTRHAGNPDRPIDRTIGHLAEPRLLPRSCVSPRALVSPISRSAELSCHSGQARVMAAGVVGGGVFNVMLRRDRRPAVVWQRLLPPQ